jgi:hypothetical protein
LDGVGRQGKSAVIVSFLLRDEGTVGEGAGLAEGGEGFEEVFDAVGAGAFEGGGGGGGGAEGGELGADGLGLLGEGFGPGAFAGGGGGDREGGVVGAGVEAGLGGGAGGVLELGAQPADEAAPLFGGALGSRPPASRPSPLLLLGG